MSFARWSFVVACLVGTLTGCASSDGAHTDDDDRGRRKEKELREEVSLLRRQLEITKTETEAIVRENDRLTAEVDAARETSSARKKALDASLARMRSNEQELIDLRKRAKTPQTLKEAQTLLLASRKQIRKLRSELALARSGKSSDKRDNPNLLVELSSINFEKPVVRIDGRSVSRRDFAEFLYRDLAAPRLLELFVNRTLVLREARLRRIEVSDVDAEMWVSAQINEQLRQCGDDEEKLGERLAGMGFTKQTWEARLRYQAKPMLKIRRLVLINRRTRAGKKAWDDRLRAAYHERYSERAQARHVFIGIGPKATSAIERAALHKADAVYQQLRSGVRFDKVALYHSDDKATKSLGGSLGTFDRNKFRELPQLNAALFTLPTGKVSKPVRSRAGYHVILVEKRLPPARRFDAETRRILTKELAKLPPSNAEVQALVERLRKKTKIETSLEFD